MILLDSWNIFREYVERWPFSEILYHVDELDNERTRVRVVAGRYGIDLALSNNDDLLDEVLDFLKEKSGKRTLEVVKDIETFFSR